MAQAPRDQNRVTAILGTSSVDDATPIAIAVDPSSRNLEVEVTENVLVGAPLVGQAVIAVTGTAVQLASNALENGVILTAKSTNTAPISIGGSGVNNTVNGTGNGYILEAGASISFAVANTNDLYINGTAGDICSFAGS